jgi:adenosine deaminase CECR1
MTTLPSSVYNPNDDPIQYTFSKDQPAPIPGTNVSWVRVVDARENHPQGIAHFDHLLFQHQSVWSDDPVKEYTTVDGVWKRFQNTFFSNSGLFTYLPVYRNYLREIIHQLIIHNTMYTELRMLSLVPWYDLDGNQFGFDKAMEVARQVVQEMKSLFVRGGKGKRVDFIGLKFVFSVLRDSSKEKVQAFLEEAIELKQRYPDMIAGILELLCLARIVKLFMKVLI